MVAFPKQKRFVDAELVEFHLRGFRARAHAETAGKVDGVHVACKLLMRWLTRLGKCGQSSKVKTPSEMTRSGIRGR